MLSGIKPRGRASGFGLPGACLALVLAGAMALPVAMAAGPAADAAPAKRPAEASTPAKRPAGESLGGGAPLSVLAMLGRAGVGTDEIGLLAVPLDGGKPLARWNEDRAFNPASTMKLLTTYAALGMLGQDYRWRTGVYLTGLLDGDRLDGDLV